MQKKLHVSNFMKIFLILFLALLFQISGLARMFPGDAFVNLALALAVLFWFSAKNRSALILPMVAAAAFAGMLSAVPFIAAPASFAAVLAAFYLLSSFVPHRTFLHACVFAVAGVVVSSGALWVFSYGAHAAGLSAFSPWSLTLSLSGIAGEAAATLAALAILYPLRAWITS